MGAVPDLDVIPGETEQLGRALLGFPGPEDGREPAPSPAEGKAQAQLSDRECPAAWPKKPQTLSTALLDEALSSYGQASARQVIAPGFTSRSHFLEFPFKF